MLEDLLWIFVLVLRFKGTTAPCSTEDPVKTWPLGQGILNREIISNDPPESRGSFDYTSTNLGYNGLLFYGNSSSYVDILFDGSSDDFSLYFYINPSEHGGCILHYKSNQSTEIGITEYRLDMETDGALTYSVKTNGINLANDGNDTGTFAIPTNQWSNIIIEFDISKKGAAITADNWNSEMSGDVMESAASLNGPGIMRIGSPQDDVGSSFAGGISCLHYIPDKGVCEDAAYETKCKDNWPSTTSTTTTSTTTTSTSTTTTTPTTTSASTTTTTPTTTSTSTTTTTPTTSTSTTTTTPTTTSTSTTTTTPTTTSTSTTTTTPTTSTSTTTTTPTTTSTSTTTTTPTTTSTSTTTTTPTTSTSTTTTTPTTTSTSTTTTTPTTTFSSTTTTPPTTTSTTTTAPTTSSTSTSTTTPTATSILTTTPLQPTTSTSTTMPPPTTSFAITTTSLSTSPSFLTTAILSSTSATSTTATNIPTLSPLSSSSLSPSLGINQFFQTTWRRYNKNSIPTTYADSSDVISVNLVNDVRECLIECGNYAECMTFSFTSVSGTQFYTCKTGKIGAPTMFDIDSSLYEVVEVM